MKPLSKSKEELKLLVPQSYHNMGDYALVRIFQQSHVRKQRDTALMCLTYRHMGALVKNTITHCGQVWSEDCFIHTWEGMVKGLRKFNLDNPKQVKVITYLYWWMRKGAQTWLTKKAREDKHSFRGWSEDISSSPLLRTQDPCIEKQELVDKVREVISQFPGNKTFIRTFYGLDGGAGKNIPTIAKETGVPVGDLRKELLSFKLYVKQRKGLQMLL
jgi:RNA polymerase sigma factor (sigma-70 family)